MDGLLFIRDLRCEVFKWCDSVTLAKLMTVCKEFSMPAWKELHRQRKDFNKRMSNVWMLARKSHVSLLTLQGSQYDTWWWYTTDDTIDNPYHTLFTLHNYLTQRVMYRVRALLPIVMLFTMMNGDSLTRFYVERYLETFRCKEYDRNTSCMYTWVLEARHIYISLLQARLVELSYPLIIDIDSTGIDEFHIDRHVIYAASYLFDNRNHPVLKDMCANVDKEVVQPLLQAKYNRFHMLHQLYVASKKNFMTFVKDRFPNHKKVVRRLNFRDNDLFFKLNKFFEPVEYRQRYGVNAS